jgi:hypothetical protein
MKYRRKLAAMLLAGTAATATIAVTGAPAHAAGFSQINIWNENQCLDNAREDATKLQIWSCSGGGPQQMWLEGFNTQTGFFTFTNENTGRCITAPAVGTWTVTMAPCDAAAETQQWRVYAADNPLGPPSGWYDVWQNVKSQYCLTTPSDANGTVVRTWTCDPSDKYDRWHQR